MRSVELQLENLYADEVLASLFAERKMEPPWTFEAVFEELGKLGEPLLGAHDEELGKRGVEQYFVCSLGWRVEPDAEPNRIVASGATPVLAALYCLMEALYTLHRAVFGDSAED